MKRLIIYLVLIVLFESCIGGLVHLNSVVIYKFKPAKDYSNNVFVLLSEDKTTIMGYPSSINHLLVELDDDYYMDGLGINTGYLSMTIDELNSYETSPGVDTLASLLIETDPFLEYYSSVSGYFKSGSGKDAEYIDLSDTAFVNTLIKEGKLEEYFDREK